jgi:hypothetical protein
MGDIKLRPEVKQEWIAALRSGEYEQGQNALNAGGKLCCLGVLCEVAIRHGVIPAGRPGDGSIFYAGESMTLPDEVAGWAFADGGYDTNPLAGGTLSLAEHNDAGESFTAIAGLIERYL